MKHFNESSLQRGFILDYLTGLNCARSLTVALLYKYNEHSQLVALEFNPLDYNDLDSARDSLAATKLLSKATFLDLKIDLRKTALDSFFAAEQICKETNHRISRSLFTTKETPELIFMMQKSIHDILGSIDADEFIDNCNFGPGATTLLPRRSATHPNKFDSENRISLDAYDFVEPWFRSAYPNWDIRFEILGSSKIVTVPKNAKTDRTIAIEPGINLWFQKGIGNILRKRLYGAGIDLRHQEINQRRSRIASKFNRLATVDFTAASDTVSKELIYLLLPSKWFALLNAFRSTHGIVDGKTYNFHKFSSMGNGFTFELETMIFYSLALACCQLLGVSTSGISVYGDDVILPVDAIELFTSAAADLGFSLNKRKSYSSTYYRESCGAHWWNGIDIKPIFLKEPLSGKCQIIKLANSIRRLSHNRMSFGCDLRLFDTYRNLTAPLSKVARISDGYGDCGLIENINHPAVRYTRARHGIEGFHVKVWTPHPHMVTYESRGLLLTKLKAIGDREIPWWDARFSPDLAGIGNDIPLPNRTKMAKVRLLIPQWADLGPWI